MTNEDDILRKLHRILKSGNEHYFKVIWGEERGSKLFQLRSSLKSYDDLEAELGQFFQYLTVGEYRAFIEFVAPGYQLE